MYDVPTRSVYGCVYTILSIHNRLLVTFWTTEAKLSAGANTKSGRALKCFVKHWWKPNSCFVIFWLTMEVSECHMTIVLIILDADPGGLAQSQP